MTHHRSIAKDTKTPCPCQSSPYRDLVERAETLILADIGEPLHISALCLALAVSERTLRKAFYKVRSHAPCRHLRMLRLSEARKALLAVNHRPITVTEIATSFGFLELGRFSVEYRKVFGESPSQTLSPYRGSRRADSETPSFAV